jgi:hypothetical protein
VIPLELGKSLSFGNAVHHHPSHHLSLQLQRKISAGLIILPTLPDILQYEVWVYPQNFAGFVFVCTLYSVQLGMESSHM